MRQLFANRVGISLGSDKQYLVVNRLTPLARQHGFDSLHAFIDVLKQSRDSPIWEDVVDVLAVHETSFFRDDAPFCQIRDEILPALCETAKRASRPLQIWSAGCSTGQEAYSVAMLLAEIAPRMSPRARIVGSDVSGKVLRTAEQGRYRTIEICRGLNESRRRRFMCEEDGVWTVVPELRGLIEWQKFSLSGDWPALPKFDLVLLRNVMVYFPTDVRDRLIARVHDQLVPGGRFLLD